MIGPLHLLLGTLSDVVKPLTSLLETLARRPLDRGREFGTTYSSILAFPRGRGRCHAGHDREGGSATYLWLMPMGRWGATEFVLGLAMWAIMMIGRWYQAPLFWPYGLQVGLQPAHGDWHRTSKLDI